jgi:hypothetical protein
MLWLDGMMMMMMLGPEDGSKKTQLITSLPSTPHTGWCSMWRDSSKTIREAYKQHAQACNSLAYYSLETD